MILREFLFVLCFSMLCCAGDKKYVPNWDSLDSRPLPQWFDEAKFGIFIHWGVFSVPSFKSEWFWQYQKVKLPEVDNFMRKNYKPGFSYQEFAKDFTATFYDPKRWSEIFENSGAKYIVLTSKHHEGYTLWPSKYSFSWNAMDVGPHRDLVGELADAIRKNTNLKFGLYHSLFEFFNPLWLNDDKNNFTTKEFVHKKTMPELRELIENYKPEVLWSDGEAHATEEYWESREFLAWLYNDSPVKDTVVTNDRWGKDTHCKHGDFYSCADRFNPGTLQLHKWENAMTIDRKSWGYRRNAELSDYFSLKDLVKELVTTVSCGGNLLMNVGPTKDGIIAPIYEERLLGMGEWLKTNGEAIYYSQPWKVQNDTISGDVWYTVGKNGDLYASMLNWPESDVLKLGAVRAIANTQIRILGSDRMIDWEQLTNHLAIKLPQSAHRGQPAWVLWIKNYEQSRY
ncbi:alpha-L-fucosidase-like [Nasonia vitripennis]|uniref:Putative alpha-L-fucosidase n=1 Tax=Nasonia vitripennis TaxID=7425 RepID=A0A7M7G5K1_NASVI|nr:alpha-L-fucosidase-like [Nasonia vitripennis]